jgi:hypothetical protein
MWRWQAPYLVNEGQKVLTVRNGEDVQGGYLEARDN